jgi:hypothetical protein
MDPFHRDADMCIAVSRALTLSEAKASLRRAVQAESGRVRMGSGGTGLPESINDDQVALVARDRRHKRRPAIGRFIDEVGRKKSIVAGIIDETLGASLQGVGKLRRAPGRTFDKLNEPRHTHQ